MILWEGTAETFENFLTGLNNNRYGITFTGKWHSHQIDYLDLQISKEGGQLLNGNVFQKKYRYSYIPTSSCHYPKWKDNISNGQLLRVRRNCNLVEDFEEQADILIKKFKEKRYQEHNLIKLKEEIKGIDRNSLMIKQDRKKANNYMDIAFITGFSNQYQQLEHIIKNYWPILKEDRTLSKILPKKPRFIYRRAPTLRNYLVHNVIDPPRPVKIFPELKGFYKCQRCLLCRVSKKQPRKKTTFKSRSNNKEYQIKELTW